jgi:hypothetical protein
MKWQRQAWIKQTWETYDEQNFHQNCFINLIQFQLMTRFAQWNNVYMEY